MFSNKTLYLACIFAVSATAAQAQDQNCPPLKQVAAIKLDQTQDGRWLVPVTINGNAKKFLLSTRDAASAMWIEYAKELNLEITDATAPAAPSGAPSGGGRGRGSSDTPSAPAQKAQVARLEGFALGPIQSGAGYFKVANDTNKEREANADVVGILGTDLLSREDFDMDFGAKTLNLFSSDHCAGRVVYWNGPTVAVPFTIDTKGQIRFPLVVDGTELSGTLDTGAAHTTMSLVFGKRKLGISETDEGYDRVETPPLAPAQYTHRFKAIDLGGLALPNPLVYVIDDSQTNKPRVSNSAAIRDVVVDATIPDVVLGTSVLNKFHLYIETRERKIYVTPAVAPAP